MFIITLVLHKQIDNINTLINQTKDNLLSSFHTFEIMNLYNIATQKL